jgi:hypothetical protein
MFTIMFVGIWLLWDIFIYKTERIEDETEYQETRALSRRMCRNMFIGGVFVDTVFIFSLATA